MSAQPVRVGPFLFVMSAPFRGAFFYGVIMDYVRKSRRNWVFTTSDLSLDLQRDGVKIQDGKANFALDKFESKEDCLKWISENLEESVKLHKSQGMTKGIEVTPQEFDLIKEHMRSPGDFTTEDVRVFEDFLCHNLPDRDGERFVPATLKRFQETLPGKQRLIGHNWSVKGNGRYYDAKIVKMTVDQAIQFFGKKYPAKNARKIFQKIADIDGSIQWLVAKFYVLSMTWDAVELDAGIGGDSSIGFAGIERKLYEDGDFRVIELHPRDDCEALEGSDVGVPAQPGAGTKDFGPDNGEAGAERTETPNSGGKSMQFEVKALEIDMPVTEEGLEADIKAVHDAVELKAAEMQGNIDVLTSEIDTLKAEIETQKSFVAEKESELKSEKEIADELKSDLEDELIKMSVLAGLYEDSESAERKEIYRGRSVKELKMDLKAAESAYAKVTKKPENVPTEEEPKKSFYPTGANRL